MSQANVSRGKAIKALKNNQNDIVNAIMVSSEMLVFFLCGPLSIDFQDRGRSEVVTLGYGMFHSV
jgi:hypothetical protein